MHTIINFWRQLAANNNKPWFDAHKADYLDAKAHLETLASQFIDGVAQFDHRCRGLQIKDCTYRIYRDIRFSPDKRPYKDWCGIYVCPRGKKSGMAGYYIHIEPAADNFFLCSGLYNPTKEVLQSVREQISLDPDTWLKSFHGCLDFQFSWPNALKRMPAGYDEQGPASRYIRLRSYEICLPVTEEQILAPDFLAHALADLRRTLPYNDLLNRCHDYAYDPDRD